MTNPVPIGTTPYKSVPNKAHRRPLSRPVHKLRLCKDNRAYAFIPFTISGDAATGDYTMWPADRDYWIARITADVGKHDSGSHPNDGTPGGQAIRANVRRVRGDTDVAILGDDTRLHISANGHRDAVTNSEDGPYDLGDFNVRKLKAEDHIYLRVSQVGTTRPGQNLVVTVILVPIP